MNKAIKCVVAVFAMVTATASEAVSLTYNFSGQRVFSNIAGTASTFSGSFVYDPLMPPHFSTPSGDASIYFSLSSFALLSGGVSVSAVARPIPVGDPDRHAFISVINSNVDIFSTNIDDSNSDITPGFTSILFELRNFSGNAFTSTALPALLNLSNFQVRKVVLIKAGAQFEGEVTSLVLASQVPEPISWIMLTIGFGIVGATMRRREHRLVYSTIS